MYRLHEIQLGRSKIAFLYSNEILGKGAIEIFRNTSWTRLEKLVLVKNELGNEEAIAIYSNET